MQKIIICKKQWYASNNVWEILKNNNMYANNIWKINCEIIILKNNNI